MVGRAGTGVDNIDLQAATRKGVIVLKYVYDLKNFCFLPNRSFSNKELKEWNIISFIMK